MGRSILRLAAPRGGRKVFSEPIKTKHEKKTFFWFWTGLRQSQYGTFYFTLGSSTWRSESFFLNPSRPNMKKNTFFWFWTGLRQS